MLSHAHQPGLLRKCEWVCDPAMSCSHKETFTTHEHTAPHTHIHYWNSQRESFAGIPFSYELLQVRS